MVWIGHPNQISNSRPELTPMSQLDRITFDPKVMGGKQCIRGMRVTVETIVGLMLTQPDQLSISN